MPMSNISHWCWSNHCSYLQVKQPSLECTTHARSERLPDHRVNSWIGKRDEAVAYLNRSSSYQGHMLSEAFEKLSASSWNKNCKLVAAARWGQQQLTSQCIWSSWEWLKIHINPESTGISKMEYRVLMGDGQGDSLDNYGHYIPMTFISFHGTSSALISTRQEWQVVAVGDPNNCVAKVAATPELHKHWLMVDPAALVQKVLLEMQLTHWGHSRQYHRINHHFSQQQAPGPAASYWITGPANRGLSCAF